MPYIFTLLSVIGLSLSHTNPLGCCNLIFRSRRDDLVFARFGRQGGLVKVIKVWVRKGLLRGNPLGRVVNEHFSQEVYALLVDVGVLLDLFFETVGVPDRKGRLEVWQPADPRPDLVSGGAQHPEYPEQLIDLGVALKTNRSASASWPAPSAPRLFGVCTENII